MNKDISVGNDFGELPSLDNSSSSNSSGGLDKLMKSFNENKLQIVAFLSFFLFIIFTMSLVLGSVDFTDEGGGGGEKSYSGNKSLDKLYEEAGGNEALSNARMTSKIDLSTEDYSCSYFVEYEGNNERKVYCTSCPDSIEEDVTANDKFCRQFVYGDDGDFEYSLLDNEYVSQRRARKESESDRQFAAGDLPECTRTIVDESKLGTREEREGQICELNTSGDSDSNLKAVDCSPGDIETIRDLKYENKCDCSKFSNTNDADCNSNNDNHKCEISEDKESCQSATGEDNELNEMQYIWTIFKYSLFIFVMILIGLGVVIIRIVAVPINEKKFPTLMMMANLLGLILLFISLIMYLVRWSRWAGQYKYKYKKHMGENRDSKKLENYKFWEAFILIVVPIFYICAFIIAKLFGVEGIKEGNYWKNFKDKNLRYFIIIGIVMIIIGIYVAAFWGIEDDPEMDKDEDGNPLKNFPLDYWPLRWLIN